MVTDVRIDDQQMAALRQEVLGEWPTGARVDIEEAIEYHRQASVPTLVAELAESRRQGRCLLSALAGVATLDGMIELDKALIAAGCDFAPTSIDTNTRWHRFEKAASEAERSKELGTSTLNGFPLVHHGVGAARTLVESVGRPVICRHSAEDARLLAEISYAGGYTAFTGGATAAFTCYGNRPLPEVIRNWQYVERLTGMYQEAGVDMFRDQTRYVIGAGGFPPSCGIVLAICNALLSSTQGVKHIGPAHCQQGSILQNVAAILVEKELVEEYLARAGHTDVTVYKYIVTWNGAFPRDEAASYGILLMAAVVSALAGADILIAKSIQEAFGVPTLEANTASMRALRYTLDLLEWQRMPTDAAAFRAELDILRRETTQLMDRILELGEGDVVVGLTTAFELGEFDVPFSPNPHVRGEVLPAKDETGAIRITRFGNLAVDASIKEFHASKLAQRMSRTGESDDLSVAVDDIMRGLLSPAVTVVGASEARVY